MACIKSLAASVVKYGLACLKLAKLNLMVLATFLTCFLNVKLQSKMIPRYLKSDTAVSFSPSIKGAVHLMISWRRTYRLFYLCSSVGMTFLASQRHGPMLRLV